MCPYVPVSSGRRFVVLPLNRWVSLPTYTNIYWYVLGLFFVFSTSPIIASAIIIVLMLSNRIAWVSDSFFGLLLVSAIISMLFLYFFLKRNMYYMMVSIRVSFEKMGCCLNNKIEDVVTSCFGTYMEKKKDFKDFKEFVYFSSLFRLNVYVKKDREYATMKLRIYSKKVYERIMCFIDRIGEELDVGNELIPVHELLRKKRGSEDG